MHCTGYDGFNRWGWRVRIGVIGQVGLVESGQGGWEGMRMGENGLGKHRIQKHAILTAQVYCLSTSWSSIARGLCLCRIRLTLYPPVKGLKSCERPPLSLGS